ncbi:hypothetical protein [Eleftheria terrae]|uniref:hypothetical protein n=1 Tax=Eleftheria terrae TaxID=1597781 RepID=UPI00263B6A7B|nr:hypothetical protein [Eleftheria terrae]WKB50513.1 hypothetical protein N7L95_00255 [Eleftheria terrae]
MRAFSRKSDWALQGYSRLPVAARESLLPVVLASVPMAIGTAFAPTWLIPVVLLLTFVLLHEVTAETERFMFKLDRARAHVAISMPLTGFVSLWGLCLAGAGRRDVMLSVVGPYCLLLLLVCAPAYRLFQARQQRRVPLRVTFPVCASLVFLCSLAAI